MPASDKYKVVHNPMRVYLNYEVWCSGERQTWTGTTTLTEQVVKCVKSFRTKEKAEASISYWTELQAFKENT